MHASWIIIVMSHRANSQQHPQPGVCAADALFLSPLKYVKVPTKPQHQVFLWVAANRELNVLFISKNTDVPIVRKKYRNLRFYLELDFYTNYRIFLILTLI